MWPYMKEKYKHLMKSNHVAHKNTHTPHLNETCCESL